MLVSEVIVEIRKIIESEPEVRITNYIVRDHKVQEMSTRVAKKIVIVDPEAWRSEE